MPLDSFQIEEIRRLLQHNQKTLNEAAGLTSPAAEADTGAKDAKKKPAKKAAKKTTKKTKNIAPKPDAKKSRSPIKTAILSELKEVSAALARLNQEQHRFGYCEACFMEIPWRELVMKPARRFCTRCS